MARNVAARWGARLSALFLLVAFCALQLSATNAVAQEQDSPQPYAFEITELNEGLVDAEMTPGSTRLGRRLSHSSQLSTRMIRRPPPTS
jgi:hypothetical protein